MKNIIKNKKNLFVCKKSTWNTKKMLGKNLVNCM